MEIELPRPLVNQLLHCAQESPEAEVCGLIGARGGVPNTCYPVRNASAQPRVRFQLDPAGQIEAMRRMRERGEELFAIFHSHPATPAEPSPSDLSEAAYPDAVYLIISLNTKGVLEMRGYRKGETQTFREINLVLQ
ncbi:MAG: Mov34/MPN/PAD family protein [Proteobacteria bacterium]|nr:Mov34/MPN/PAD family protein [Pseudomonadota bacterium]